MRVVNIFGGPGAGKSTTAAGLFYRMKLSGLRVELVTEYAKDLTYEKNKVILGNQLTVLGEQFNRVNRAKDEVDWIVTDSPLLLSALYAEGVFKEHWFFECVKGAFNTFNNYNIYLNRVQPFQQYGRRHNEEESVMIDGAMLDLLDAEFDYFVVDGDETAPQKILEHLKLTKENKNF